MQRPSNKLQNWMRKKWKLREWRGRHNQWLEIFKWCSLTTTLCVCVCFVCFAFSIIFGHPGSNFNGLRIVSEFPIKFISNDGIYILELITRFENIFMKIIIVGQYAHLNGCNRLARKQYCKKQVQFSGPKKQRYK